MRRALVYIVTFLLLTSVDGIAQQNVTGDRKVTAKEQYPGLNEPTDRRKIGYPVSRPADVIWKKRILRKIDLRQKMNQPMIHLGPRLYVDRSSLSQEIFTTIMDFKPYLESDGIADENAPKINVNILKEMMYDDVKLYDGNEWPFSKGADVESLFKDKLEIDVDSLNKVEVLDYVVNSFSSITSYFVFEEWFFDSKYSRVFVRVLGLCPLLEVDKGDTEVKAVKPLFWVKYEDIRGAFMNAQLFNPRNDKIRLSLDDVFQKRYFQSVIVGEENVKNNMMLEEIYEGVTDPVERNYLISQERKRIEEEIFNFEHDLWEY